MPICVGHVILLTWSCGKSPVSFVLNMNGIGMNRNRAIKNTQPVTAPIASGLELTNVIVCFISVQHKKTPYIFGRFRLLTSVPCKFALTNMSLRLGIKLFVSLYEHIDMNILITMDKLILAFYLFVHLLVIHRTFLMVVCDRAQLYTDQENIELF